jgi:hypothetical protein
VLLNDVVDVGAAGQDVGEADAAHHAEVAGDLGLAEVGLDDGHAAACVGQGQPEVDHRGRLALRRQRAGDHDDLGRLVDLEELQVVAQLPVVLGRPRVRDPVNGVLLVQRLVAQHCADHRGSSEASGLVRILD